MKVYTFRTVDNVSVGETGHTHTRKVKKGEDPKEREHFCVDCDVCAPYLLADPTGTWQTSTDKVPLTYDEAKEEERAAKSSNQELLKALADLALSQQRTRIAGT